MAPAWPMLLVFFFFLSTTPYFANAAELRTGEQPSVDSQERINDDLYIAGWNPTISGTVLGDLLAAGGSVLINGEGRSDVLAGGGTVTILGKVADDLRIVGGNVLITGAVADDVVAAAGNLRVSGMVGGDALLAGGAVRIDAPIGGNARIIAGDVYVDAPIGGTLLVEADNITLGSAAVIGNDFTYRAASRATLEEGALVNGETTYAPRTNIRQDLKSGVIAFLSLWFVLKFLMLLVGAMVFGLFFKRYCVELTKRSLAEPLPQFLIGLVTIIVLPVVSGVLIATVVGMPLGILGFLSFFSLLTFGGLITPAVLGGMLSVWLFKSTGEVSWKTILLGVVVFYVAGFVPFVGWLARIFFLLLSLGAALRFKWSIAREWR